MFSVVSRTTFDVVEIPSTPKTHYLTQNESTDSPNAIEIFNFMFIFLYFFENSSNLDLKKTEKENKESKHHNECEKVSRGGKFLIVQLREE